MLSDQPEHGAGGDVRLCQESQLVCQESSSSMGKVAHVTVCFGLNLTHPLAEYFLACLWVYRHSLSACCSTPTVRGDCHLLSTEQPGECTTMVYNLLLWRCSTRALHFIPCPSLTVRANLNTNHKGMPASPLACPSFSQSLIDSSGESHKLS